MSASSNAANGPAPKGANGGAKKLGAKNPAAAAVAAAQAAAAPAATAAAAAVADDRQLIAAAVARDADPDVPKCQTWEAGLECKFGSKCRFKHLPNWTMGPKAQAEAAKRNVCQLDVAVPDDVLPLLQRGIDPIQVVNGQEKRSHALNRAMRTVATFKLHDMVQRGYSNVVKPTGPVLWLQHTIRGLLPPGDVCRLNLFPEDADHVCEIGVEAGQCSHSRKMREHYYKTIVLIDCPISCLDALNLVRDSGAQLLMLNHVYVDAAVTSTDQRSIWSSVVCSDRSTSGSLGSRVITCPGVTAIKEPDMFWLVAQSAPFLKVEQIWEDAWTYRIHRVTLRSGVDAPEPFEVPVRHMLMAGGPGIYSVGDGLVYKFSDRFAVLEQDDWYPFNPNDVIWALGKLSGRDSNEVIRARIISQAGTRDFDLDTLLHVTNVLKVKEELAPLAAAYQPQEQGLFGTGWFRWLMPTRRNLDAERALMRRGLHVVAGSPLTLLVIGMVFLILSIIGGWPVLAYHRDVDPGWLTPLVGGAAGYCWPVPLHEDWWRLVFAPLHAVWRVLGATYVWCARVEVLEWTALTRFNLMLLGLLLMARSAKAVEPAFDLRAHYVDNPWAPVNWTGALPGPAYGLPSLIMTQELRPLGRGCKVQTRSVDDDGSRERDGLWAHGLVFGQAIPSVCRPCQQNELVAARNRQCAAMPDYDFDSWAAAEDLFVLNYPLPDEEYRWWANFDEWNARFPPARQREHIAAMQRWMEGPTPTYDEVHRGSSFIKVEKKFDTGPYDPRCISGKGDLYNVVAGPWTYAVTKAFKKAFDWTRNVFYADSTTSAELGAWFERQACSPAAGTSPYRFSAAICGDDQIMVEVWDGCTWFIEVDGSRHDAHMHEGFHSMKWRLYAKVARYIPPIVRSIFMEGQRTSTAYFPHGVKYTHLYRTRSGDPDTKIGNTMCTHFVAEQVSRTGRACYEAVRDELMLTATHSDEMIADRLAATIVDRMKQSFGYDAKVKVTRDPTRVTFLSGAFIPVGGRYYWAPLPGKLIPRLGWTLRGNHAKGALGQANMYRLFAGTLNGFWAYRFVPFLRVYLAHAMNLVPSQFRHSHSVEEHRQVRPSGIEHADPDRETWVFFLGRYGLTEEDEAKFQVELSQATSLPFMVSSDIIARLTAVDL